MTAKTMTKTQLVDENIRLRAECERLSFFEAECARLNRHLAEALKQRDERTTTPRATRTVFEFDPTVAGDFARASKLAKEQGGSVKRVQQ